MFRAQQDESTLFPINQQERFRTTVNSRILWVATIFISPTRKAALDQTRLRATEKRKRQTLFADKEGL